LPPNPRERQLVSREQVARIASLAKLSLSPKEEEMYSRELSVILQYFRVLDKAKVGRALPEHIMAVTNSFRGEEIIKTDPEPILAGVPKKKGRFVKAPRVF
jgi:aspartyl-tRNA(Asn)/glutamyl-tRNA(Gln) amidotransferase subunit C